VVRAIDAKGSPIGEARYAFGMQDRESEAAFRSARRTAQRHFAA